MRLNLGLSLEHHGLILEEHGAGERTNEDGGWPPIMPSRVRVTLRGYWNVVHEDGLRSFGGHVIAVHLVTLADYVHTAFAADKTAVTRFFQPRVKRDWDGFLRTMSSYTFNRAAAYESAVAEDPPAAAKIRFA